MDEVRASREEARWRDIRYTTVRCVRCNTDGEKATARYIDARQLRDNNYDVLLWSGRASSPRDAATSSLKRGRTTILRRLPRTTYKFFSLSGLLYSCLYVCVYTRLRTVRGCTYRGSEGTRLLYPCPTLFAIVYICVYIRTQDRALFTRSPSDRSTQARLCRCMGWHARGPCIGVLSHSQARSWFVTVRDRQNIYQFRSMQLLVAPISILEQLVILQF